MKTVFMLLINFSFLPRQAGCSCFLQFSVLYLTDGSNTGDIYFEYKSTHGHCYVSHPWNWYLWQVFWRLFL